jgi:hypothetical protein
MNLSGELNLSEIRVVDFPATQYFQVKHTKTQICLHHSSGSDNAKNFFEGWKVSPERVATCMAIEDDGELYKIFSSEYWAYHINVASKGNQSLYEHPLYGKYLKYNAVDIENRTIGVEVCNWGGLKLIDGQYHTYVSKAVDKNRSKLSTVDESKVIHYPGGWRGYEYFERYTDKELEALWRLLRFWCKTYGIPTRLTGDIFDLNLDAFMGSPGVYTHASYRQDKSDMHPQPELKQMLAAL